MPVHDAAFPPMTFDGPDDDAGIRRLRRPVTQMTHVTRDFWHQDDGQIRPQRIFQILAVIRWMFLATRGNCRVMRNVRMNITPVPETNEWTTTSNLSTT